MKKPAQTFEFTEIVNINHCKYLLSLSLKEFIEAMYDKEELNHSYEPWEVKSYYNQVRKYCQSCIEQCPGEMEGGIKQTYAYSKAQQTQGRIYVQGFGLQGLQNKLRKLLLDSVCCNEIYYDYDIQNCQPTITLQLAKNAG